MSDSQSPPSPSPEDSAETSDREEGLPQGSRGGDGAGGGNGEADVEEREEDEPEDSGRDHEASDEEAGREDDGEEGEDSSRAQRNQEGEEGRDGGEEGEEDLEEEEDEEEEGLEGSAQAILGSILTGSKEKLDKAGKKESGKKAEAVAAEPAPEEAEEATAADKEMMDDIQNTLNFITNQAEQPGSGADPTFVRLRTEYDKLHRLFQQSRKNEKSLIRKCKDLAAELSANAAKVQAALKLSQNDRSTITALKKEVKKAWKMVEAGTEKESRAKEAIASLKNEVETLRKTISEQGLSATGATSATYGRDKLIEIQVEQEEQIRTLTQANTTLTREAESAQSEIHTLRNEVSDLESRVQVLIGERGSQDQELLTLKDLLATKKSELDRDGRNREKLEASLKQAIESGTKKDAEVQSKIEELRVLRASITDMEQTFKDEKKRIDKTEKEKDHLNARLGRLQQEYDEQVLTTTRLLSENQQQTGELKSWEEEVAKLKEEVRSATRVRDTLSKKIKSLEETKLEAEVERDQLRAVNHGLSYDLDNVRKELDAAHKQAENVSRERDIAQKNFVKATGATQKQYNVVKLAEQTKRNLEQEIMGYKDEAGKMRKVIWALEKERDKNINEASKTKETLNLREEEIKMNEMLLFDSRKKITELERKLKEQQSLYENVRADRNLYSKNLIESQDEITEMKRKLKIMNHQIEQLKEEIANKEAALVKEHFEHSKLDKEKETLSGQIAKVQQQYEDALQQIQNQQAEENKLRHIIAEADAERLRQKKEYDAVVQERDILGTQLIRRNDELSLLYEKIKIQSSTLNKGELQYRERLEDIRVLKLEIKKLRREKAILQTETQNVEGLRAEIFRLQREVLRERTRVKVLEEELESPMNIHRWRKLSGSDPSTYELITKIQTLQKRLISKTEEVVEKELVIARKEKLYKEVKEVLQRQPGPEIVEELRVCREALKTKFRESKALASELNMYHSQVNEYKYEIERLNREIQDLKKKYYERRKRDNDRKGGGGLLGIGGTDFGNGHGGPGGGGGGGGGFGGRGLPGGGTLQDSHGGRPSPPPPHPSLRPHPPPGPKFSGGGFNLSTGPHQSTHHHYVSPSATGTAAAEITEEEAANARALVEAAENEAVARLAAAEAYGNGAGVQQQQAVAV
ncbi:hypothetical protein HDV00_004639 [Rhizophlyctis rosea]|nr:hypothetical protein HDV00_004639 [Rhizophlyctis rosea]